MVCSMLSSDSAVKRHVLASDSGPLPFDSMKPAVPGEDSTLGERLLFAIHADHHRGPTAAEAALMAKYPEVFRSRGFLSSYISGRRGAKTPDPKVIKIIADFLHVTFEWLMIGSGPIRRDGRNPLEAGTPFELAIFVARTLDIRPDAWDVAWERNRDRAAELTAVEWTELIRDEGLRLERAGIPRPETVAIKQEGLRRVGAKKRRQNARDATKEANVIAPVVAARVVGAK